MTDNDVKEADFEVEEEAEVDKPAEIVPRGGEANILPDNLDEQIEVTKKQVQALNQLVEDVLEEGVDYGTEKGINKPFLHKPGAEQLCVTFRLAPKFTILDRLVELDHPEYPIIDYDIRCDLHNRQTGQWVGSGVGSCSSWEKNYRYRNIYENGEWVGREENEDIMDQKNTILKMAKKRSHVDAVLNATGASRLFTQDQDSVSGSGFSPSGPGSANGEATHLPNFGKAEGELISEAQTKHLKWYAKTLDPDHEDFGDQNRQIIDAIEEELESRSESKEEPADHEGKAKVDTARLKTKEMLQKDASMSTDDMMKLCEDTVEYLMDEFEDDEIDAWREVYKTIRDVVENDAELKMNDDGYIQTLPF